MRFRHLDTSLVDVDVQPRYVRVTIKNKILQLVLPCEVATDKSLSQRNVVTGALLITMPRITKLDGSTTIPLKSVTKSNQKYHLESYRATPEVSKREFLEIGPPKEKIDDLLNIVERNKKLLMKKTEKPKDVNFVDDPSVPPLE